MDLAAHFRVIAQRWVQILVVSMVLGVLVFFVSGLRADEYEATAILAVKPGATASGGTQQETATFLAQTYAKYVDTPAFLTGVIRRTKLALTPSEAKSRISASQESDLGFLNVRATGPSRHAAERLDRGAAAQLVDMVQRESTAQTNATVDPLRAQLQTLDQQLSELTPGSPDYVSLQVQISQLNQRVGEVLATPVDGVSVFSGAIAAKDPVSPTPSRDAILAFLVALIVVSELTVLARFAGDRFSGAEDSATVAELTGLPVLAKVPRGDGIEVIEAFRVLRTNLMVLEGAGKPRTVAIVSANAGAGKTFTAVHLAESAATLDEKVVLVDADLRKPAVHERMGVPRSPGLSAVLQGGDLTSALAKVPGSSFLRVLPSGAAVRDASGVLGARSFRHVLDALRAVRLVVVDTPPANLFADPMAVASQCDATILVLDVKTSRRRAVRQTLESLDQAGANLIGVVVNRTTVQKTASYYGR